MKKLIAVIFILAMFFTIPVYAEEAPVMDLLISKTATGTGSSFRLSDYFGNKVVSSFTCMLTAAGTAATTFVMILEGSVDNINFYALATNTYTVATADTAMFHVVNKGVQYVRGNYSSKTGGSTDSAITMRCTAWLP